MASVILDCNDFSMCLHLAADRAVESLRSKRADCLYDKGYVDSFNVHLWGAVGEIAFAKWAWSYPSFTVNNFSGMEHDTTLRRDGVELGVEIRHRSKPHYQLNIRDKDDKSRVYVLTRGEPPVVDVVGWIRGDEVEGHPEWRAAHGGWKECWFVPDEHLHPMEELTT